MALALFAAAPQCIYSAAADPAAASLPPAATRPVDFLKDIQPILADHCYTCHGPEKQKSDLRWDQKESVFKNGEHGPIIVPGQSASSRVIKLVAGLEPDTLMPPKGERLSDAQIGLLRAWIDQGAAWADVAAKPVHDRRDHWAFKSPQRPPLPAVHRKNWVRNPIDQFVLARLEKEGLQPSPEADRATLMRRLSLDLVGLPPTVSELNKFAADRRPSAYGELVERLLASPHYGERWGRHWLDVARYADSNGYEKDKPRSIWPYRDWVIQALNRDLPYDQFTIEQLAGDLLPNPTLDQRVATGFLRNAMLNQEGGIEPEQFRVEALIDRMDTLGKSLLGLTVNCCQCHNHKYDPFLQKDYYQLYAFLNQDDEAFTEVPTPEQQKKRDDILAKVRELEDKARKESPNLEQRIADWEQSLADAQGNWNVLDPKDWHNFATKYEKQEDKSLLGGGDLQQGGVMHVWVETQMTNITGFRLEALTNPNLMYGGPGVTARGSFLVKEFEVEATPLNGSAVTNKIKFRRAVADQEAPGFSVTNAIDGKTDKGGWTPTTTAEARNQNHQAVFECAEPVGFPGGTLLTFKLTQTFDNESKLDCHMLGSFRLSATTNEGPLKADPFRPAQRALLSVPFRDRTAEQQREFFTMLRLADQAWHWQPSFTKVNQDIAKLYADWPYPPTTLVLSKRATPRVTHIFKRGDRLRPGDEVQPDVPSFLNPFPENAPRNRLGLAQWIVDRRNPTTARVLVNRIWQEYFGQGLVTTLEDFGTRVDTPSHPELLDWLACELMEPTWGDEPTGAGKNIATSASTPMAAPWSIKHIHRLIVNSATYRQSSRVTPEIYEKDPFDRLLTRSPRLRAEGEVLQDIALSISGLLNPKIGGPSVYPPIPGSVGDIAYAGFSWPETKGEDRYRRGLYTFWKRSVPFPALSVFDVTSGETSCPRRVRSDTPLQALTTLNEKTWVEAAQGLALRIMKEGGTNTHARISYGFELCTGRKPNSYETDKLMNFWQEQYAYFEDRSEAALKVAVPEPSKLAPDINLHKLAAWAMVSRALLNLDETITRD